MEEQKDIFDFLEEAVGGIRMSRDIRITLPFSDNEEDGNTRDDTLIVDDNLTIGTTTTYPYTIDWNNYGTYVTPAVM